MSLDLKQYKIVQRSDGVTYVTRRIGLGNWNGTPTLDWEVDDDDARFLETVARTGRTANSDASGPPATPQSDWDRIPNVNDELYSRDANRSKSTFFNDGLKDHWQREWQDYEKHKQAYDNVLAENKRRLEAGLPDREELAAAKLEAEQEYQLRKQRLARSAAELRERWRREQPEWEGLTPTEYRKQWQEHRVRPRINEEQRRQRIELLAAENKLKQRLGYE